MALSEGGEVDGKHYPKRPKYEVNRKKVRWLEVFERSGGVNPFLLCDGHGSRFEMELLE